MPVTPAPLSPVPQYWTIFGHSYFQLAFGTRTQQGRADGYMERLLYIQAGLNIQNHAQAGVQLARQGDYGFGRILQLVRGSTGGAGPISPYIVGGWGGSQGAYLLGYGVNDTGFAGNTSQNVTCYQHCLRAMISRCRISAIGSLANTTGMNQGGTGSFSQSGFATTAASGYSTSGNLFYTFNAGSTLTFTLPADYNGETIAFLFGCSPSGSPGANNVWTVSGTAGLTGTFNTDNFQPATSGNNVVYCYRVKTLTASNAGQTIIFTITTMGVSTIALFDSWWLEADNPPPVIVNNVARLCTNPYNLFPTIGASGYAIYALTFTATSLSGTAVSSTPSTVPLTATWGLPTAGSMTIPSAGGTVTLSWTGTTTGSPFNLTGVTTSGGSGNYSSNTLSWAGPVDADIAAYNASITSLMTEFDSMVQIADIDSALNKSNQLFCYDGLHPNELGAAKIGQAILNAVQHLSPTSSAGSAANMNPPGPVVTPVSKPYLSGQWYTAETGGGVGGTTYTPVIGDMWAVPFFISSGVSLWTQWSMVLATSTAAPTIFAAIYDDRQLAGYPMTMCTQMANTTALSLLAAPGTYTSPTSAGNGYLNQPMDAGLYWFVVKFVTIGTCTFTTLKGPSLYVPNLSTTGGAPTGNPCAWKLTGQGTAVMSGRFPSGAVATDNAPLIGVKTLLAQ